MVSFDLVTSFNHRRNVVYSVISLIRRWLRSFDLPNPNAKISKIRWIFWLGLRARYPPMGPRYFFHFWQVLRESYKIYIGSEAEGGIKRLRVSIPIVKVNIQGSYHTICDSLVWGSDKPLRDRMARLTSAPFGNDNGRGMGCLIRSLIY